MWYSDIEWNSLVLFYSVGLIIDVDKKVFIFINIINILLSILINIF